MDRRAALIALVVTVAVAGCSTTGRDGRCSGGYVAEFTVVGYPVAEAPENATVVPASDDRIDRVEPVQRVIRRALDTGDNSALRVDETEFREIRDALDDTPLHEEWSVVRVPGVDDGTVTIRTSKYANPEGLYVESRGRSRLRRTLKMAMVERFRMPSRRQVLASGCLALAGGGAGCSRIRDAVETGESGDGTTDDAPTTTDGASTATDGTATTATGEASAFRVAVTDGDREVELFTGAAVASVGEVESARTGGYRLPMALTDAGTEAFADGLDRVGALDDPQSHQIRTYFEGELLYEATLGPGLADAIESGEFDGRFVFSVSDRETAEEVKAALE